MKKTLIHPGFFREIFRQLRVRGLVGILLLVGVNLVFFSAFLTRDPFGGISHYDARLMALPMLCRLYVFVPILVFGAYRWLMKRVESDFYHAIPLTRTQIYATTSAAILCWLFIILGSFAVVQVILYVAFGLPMNFVLYLCVFLNMMIAAVEIVAAFSIGISLCGRWFTAFFQSIAVLFLPRMILTVFWGLTEFDAGYTLPLSMILPFFNPEYNIAATPIHSLIYGINYANVPAMLYSFAYSAGLLLLGGVAFKKRRSELAEVPYASKFLQTATRVMFGLAPLGFAAVYLNALVLDREEDIITVEVLIPLILTSVLFAFIFYCLYELISSRKMKKVVMAMPGFAVCLALSAFFTFAPVLAAKLRTPKPLAAEDVGTFRFVNGPTILLPRDLDDAEYYADHVLCRHTFNVDAAGQSIAKQSESFCSGVAFHSMLNDFAYLDVRSGGLSRTAVPVNDSFAYDSLLEACMNDAALRDELAAFPKGRVICTANGLTLTEAKQVGMLFREDFEQLTAEQRSSLLISPYSIIRTESTPDVIGLSIRLYCSDGSDNCVADYRVGELTPNAARAMLNYLNERNEACARSVLKTLVADMENPEEYDPSCISFNIGNCTIYSYDYFDFDDDDLTYVPEYTAVKEAYPFEYRIIKTLSEAPVSSDPGNCVTFCVYTTAGTHRVGVAVDDALKAQIRKWITQKMLDPDYYGDYTD